MLKRLSNAHAEIDQTTVEKWVKVLVIVRILVGLRFHEAILKRGAALLGSAYRLSEADEESKGIDGYIGNIPVSIKPDTYKVKAALPGDIGIKIIYYKKTNDGVEVDYGEVF